MGQGDGKKKAIPPQIGVPASWEEEKIPLKRKRIGGQEGRRGSRKGKIQNLKASRRKGGRHGGKA